MPRGERANLGVEGVAAVRALLVLLDLVGDVEVRVDVLLVRRGEVAEQAAEGVAGAGGVRHLPVGRHVGGVRGLVVALGAFLRLGRGRFLLLLLLFLLLLFLLPLMTEFLQPLIDHFLLLLEQLLSLLLLLLLQRRVLLGHVHLQSVVARPHKLALAALNQDKQ